MNKLLKVFLESALDIKLKDKQENVAEKVPIESSATPVLPPESVPKTLSNGPIFFTGMGVMPPEKEEKVLANTTKKGVKRMKAHEMLQAVQENANKPGKIIVEVVEVAPNVFNYSVSHQEQPQA